MDRPVSGEVLFARYAYPPNELGYCGPPNPAQLLNVLSEVGSDSASLQASSRSASSPTANAQAVGDIRAQAQAFDGAWAYLETIAAATGLDPLHPRVVEAYWIGNDLLDAVDPQAFACQMRERFGGEVGADWAALDGSPDARAHHSFQVFVVYPWVRLLGRGDTALHVLDRCRIRSGQVLEVDGDTVIVRVRPLTWDGHALALGDPVEERSRWAQTDRSLAGPVAVGETVALHWDWVCDRLAPAQDDELTDRTQRQLALTNRTPAGRH